MAEDVTAVGVPEMIPVVVERERPAGSDGETDHDTTDPPVEVGVRSLMAVSFVRVSEVWE